jgi:hypothetical protein
MLGEDLDQGALAVILRGSAKDLSGTYVHDGIKVTRAMAFVLELDFHPVVGDHLHSDALESLNPGTLIEAEQVRWRLTVKLEQTFHLGEKQRIRDVQKVAHPVRTKAVCTEDPVDRGRMDRTADDLDMRVEILGRPAHRPTPATGQRALTIKSNQPKADTFREQQGPARPLRVQ